MGVGGEVMTSVTLKLFYFLVLGREGSWEVSRDEGRSVKDLTNSECTRRGRLERPTR